MKTTRLLSVFFLFALLVNLAAVPAAAAPEPSADDPNVLAKAALLVDTSTGQVLYGKNEDQKLAPASLTTIMTALLTLDAIRDGKLTMESPVTASETALSGLAGDGSAIGIKQGETLSVHSLLQFMLIVSASDASNMLAEAVSGSLDAFVDAMNAKAQSLGCKNTHFVYANDHDHPDHYSSAMDLYLITQAAMEYPAFMEICDTAQATIPPTNVSKERTIYTTNHLLSSWRIIGYRNKLAHGIKAGSSEAAGYCLISSASKRDLNLLSVVLGAERAEEKGQGDLRSFSETTRLFDWAFGRFAYRTVLEDDAIIKEVPVTLSDVDHVLLHPAEEIILLLPRDLDLKTLEYQVTVDQDSIPAPIEENQVLGQMSILEDGRVCATTDLQALNAVEADRAQLIAYKLQEFFSRTSTKVGMVLLVILILALIIWKFTLGRRRYRYGRSVSRRGGNRNYHGRRRSRH